MSKQLRDDPMNGVALDLDRPLLRKQAGAWLKQNYGVGSGSFLAKISLLGEGPVFTRFRNRTTYTIRDLDAWARSELGAPRVEADHRVPRAPAERSERAGA
jgi:hypothetical protein